MFIASDEPICDGILTKVLFKFKLCNTVWTSRNKFGMAVDLPTSSDARALTDSLNIAMDVSLLGALTMSIIYSNFILIATISPVYIDIILVSLLLISNFYITARMNE